MQMIYMFTSGEYSSYGVEAHYLAPEGFDPRKIDQAVIDTMKVNEEYYVEYQKQEDSITWSDYHKKNPYPMISVAIFKFLEENGFVELDVTKIHMGR